MNENSEDLSDAEPGSWRGESGRYLGPAENDAVTRAFERIRSKEPEVSAVLRDGETEVPGARLVGFEYRLKGEERFKEKVAERLAADLRRNPREAAESVPDALRYTYQFSPKDYVRGYAEVTEHLRRRGYELVQSRNFWARSEYKGINSRWRTPDGRLFEVQFHTPESFEAKQLTHAAYELIRNPRSDSRAVERMDDFQREVSAEIPMPDGVLDIPNYRKEGY
ncbi:MAG TPA: hypothetical protein VIL71_20655 [Spirillospora sp.]